MSNKQKKEVDIVNEKKYAEIWEDFDYDFQEALNNESIDEAHEVWCRAAETFLWWLSNGNTKLPGNKPRRGLTLPTKFIAVANKLCSRT